jgi:hypothetical protein
MPFQGDDQVYGLVKDVDIFLLDQLPSLVFVFHPLDKSQLGHPSSGVVFLENRPHKRAKPGVVVL